MAERYVKLPKVRRMPNSIDMIPYKKEGYVRGVEEKDLWPNRCLNCGKPIGTSRVYCDDCTKQDVE